MSVAPSAFGPLPQFFDNNGVPLNGGQLFTYQAGTLTKLLTYTDSTGGTPNTDPIVLNAEGRPSVGLWVTINTAYKFVLAPNGDTDPPSNPFWAVDNLTVASSLTFTGDSGSGGTSGLVPAPPAGSAAAGDYLSAGGSWGPLIVVPPPSSISARQAGYLGLPYGNNGVFLTANYTLQLSDSGCMLVSGTASTLTITIPSDATAGWPTTSATAIELTVPKGDGAWTIAPASGVLLFGPPSFTSSGNRTLSANGQALLTRVGANYWMLAGAGVS